MKFTHILGMGLILFGFTGLSLAQEKAFEFPKRIEAGSALSVPTSGSGKAVLYVAGPALALRRDVQLGESVVFNAGDLPNAGHFAALLVGPSSSEHAQFDVVAAPKAATMSFLAKPSRVAVSLHDGISGVAYVFDVYRNLILEPLPVSFQLSGVANAAPAHSVETRDGVAWIKMDSAPKAGAAQFQATAGPITDKRVVQLVPGDPCNLRMSARRSGNRIELVTEPVRDCSGNPVPDGTIVSFTEAYNGHEATVDAPLKRGVARTEMPDSGEAVLTVATGVVIGNEIRWGAGSR